MGVGLVTCSNALYRLKYAPKKDTTLVTPPAMAASRLLASSRLPSTMRIDASEVMFSVNFARLRTSRVSCGREDEGSDWTCLIKMRPDTPVAPSTRMCFASDIFLSQAEVEVDDEGAIAIGDCFQRSVECKTLIQLAVEGLRLIAFLRWGSWYARTEPMGYGPARCPPNLIVTKDLAEPVCFRKACSKWICRISNSARENAIRLSSDDNTGSL